MPSLLNRDRWSLNYDLVEGGLVLQDVKHDGFNLAHDIRVTRVWVDTEYPNGSNLRGFVLSNADLPAVGSVAVVDSSSNPGQRSAPAPFDRYQNPFGLTASFKSKQPFLSGSPNECSIDVAQKFLFANYGKSPAHEPGAVLDATRLFPLLTFSFPAVKETSKPYPKYFRADYRLDIDLDNIDEKALEKAIETHSLSPGDITTNKAAIFRDKEGLPSGWSVAGRFAPLAGSRIREIFAALEKPLPFEIASWGLIDGAAPPGISKPDTWDNVHIWPAKRGLDGDKISTPGAFHAFHCHWRWGAVSGDETKRGDLPVAGEPFKGIGWTPSTGGPLISADIPKQNLRVAVTKNDRAWSADKNPSDKEFKALFSAVRSVPDKIKDGANLVFWLSFEIFRDEARLNEKWGGPLFINGFYFAHDKDATPAKLSLAGAYREDQISSGGQNWERLARR